MNYRFAVSGAACLALVGCTLPEEREPLPDWVEDEPPTTDTDAPPVPTDTIKVTAGNNDFPVRLRETGTVEGPCEVHPNGTIEGYDEIDCTLDVSELDLFARGVDWSVYLTPGACTYVKYWHYQYEAWEVGQGPGEVSFTVFGDVVTDEVNSVNGIPYCQYDYSLFSTDAPNCCIGTYTLTITDAETGEVTSGLFGWGGRPADCYNGAAFVDPEVELGLDGFPRPHYDYPNGAAYTKEMHFDALSGTFGSNVPLANHYNSADHLDDRPAGLKGLWAEPDYVFQCLDHAEELLGQITLKVREYNEQDQMIDDGNPDTQGEEPITGEPIDDFADWAVATPGNNTFIEWGQ
jgi:hypothetical protein